MAVGSGCRGPTLCAGVGIMHEQMFEFTCSSLTIGGLGSTFHVMTIVEGRMPKPTRVRSSITGQFVKPEEAVKHPKTTVKETVKPPKKSGK